MPEIAPTARSGSRDRNVEAGFEAAVGRLEEDIVLGVLHPRERLVEDDLLARFGLKRHVARRVLAELESRGLAERRKHFGALVKSYTAREVVELYAVREILETSAARLIPLPVGAPDLAAVNAAQRLHDDALAGADLRGVYRSNLGFHTALFALSGNAVLCETIKEYERRTQPIRFSSVGVPGYLERVAAEHHGMIEALRLGDRERLVALCRSHLQPARDAYLARHGLL